MQQNPLRKLMFNIVLATALLSPVISTQLMAASAEESDANSIEPLALRGIMAELGKNMQRITGAIAREDWSQVEQAALLIADHPTPPLMEKVRILAYVGTDINQFKTKDNATHDAAMVLSKVAQEKEGYKIIKQFAELQKTCLTCHQAFRQSFVEHFYK